MAIVRDADTSIYKIRAGDLEGEELRVLRFRGAEGISQLFRFDFELVSRNAKIDFKQVVGKPAAFAIAGVEEPRHVNGMINRFEQGAVGRGFTRYYLQIVPRVWTLLHRIDSRIYQQKSVPGILEGVFKDAGIPSTAYRLALQSSYKEREYCVQYQESDWNFLARLMEEEGIFYFFEHKEDEHVLVIADSPSAHSPIAGDAKIPFRASSDLEPDGREYVATFRYGEAVRIGSVQLRDFSFKTPKANLDARDKAAEWSELELFAYPADYHAADVGRQRATAWLQAEQAMRAAAAGEGVVTRFTPGYRFTLEGHGRADLDREYLITDVRHEGHEPQALEEEMGQGEDCEYVNEFRCIPADVPYRPPRITPRPYIRGTQTATVVGPSGEEIYTDEYGRIKVRFPWDRRGEANENSSCWIRVSQPGAGGGFGFFWLPRVGQEVVVAFHEGHPDQPHVIGSVYNADQMPPYPLPDQKTKSTIKTASSKGAAGFNEIRIEDLKGEEQIFIHAEKNLDLRVKADRYEWIGADAHQIVKRDQFEQVENERHAKVGADDITEIVGDRHLKVKGKQASAVDGSLSLTVTGDVIEVFKANHSEQTSQNLYLKAMGVVIESMSGITLKTGGNSVVIDPSGVTIKGTMVTVDGSMVRIASGPGSPAQSGQAGNAVSPIAPTLPDPADEADPGKMAEAKAEQQKAGAGKYGKAKITPFKREEAEEGEEKEKSWIEIELVDEEGNPVPGERYEITLPDGKTVARGTLDENGFARVDGIAPGECKITFPRLDKDAWEADSASASDE